MSDQLAQQLQASLGASHTIERELGGGGMSRVFLARDARLDRRIVVKALAGEGTAGINAERFAREVRLAAALQAPHIVPLLGDGVTAEGTPFYTMPFVEGASLRERMAQGPVSLDDAIGILADVARALRHAHQRGVIHRDVKPENVLLSGGTAMVTDFGIAKAVEHARTGAPDDDGSHAKVPAHTLTGHGTSVGTPAYMAPEQAAGDVVDHRADLYAWGLVAYELLVGRHPFAGRASAQQLIAAQIVDPAPPMLAQLPAPMRADVRAPAVAALVMQALEKDPRSRPASADAILQAIAEIGGARAAGRDRAARWATPARRVLLVAGALGVLAAVTVGTLALRRSSLSDAGGVESVESRRGGAAARQSRIAVARFEDGAGLVEATRRLADDIGSRLVEVRVPAALASAGALPAGDSAVAAARAIQADLLVTGTVRRVADRLEARASVVRVASGEVVRTVGPIVGPLATPEVALDSLRERVVGTVALMLDSVLSDAIPAAAAQTPTYAAFREFARGEELAKQGQWSATAERYHAAWALDRSFTFVAGRLARAYFATGRCAQADSVGAVLLARRERLSEYERAALDRTLARCRGDWVTAYEASRRMTTLAPESDDARFVFAVAALGLSRADESERAFASIRADDPPMRRNAGYDAFRSVALHLQRRHADERRVAQDAERRFPGASTSFRLRLVASAALGDTATVARLGAQVAGLPLGRPFFSAQALLFTVWELGRHGHPAAARRLGGHLIDVLEAVPADRRDLGYWQARAESMYALERWRDARVATDSAEALARAMRTGERSSFDVSYGDQRDFALSLRGRIAAREGRHAEAERAMQRLLSRRGPYLRGFPTRYAAEIAAALGRRDEAVHLLRASIVQGQNLVDEYLDARPDFLSLRGHAPFEALFEPRS